MKGFIQVDADAPPEVRAFVKRYVALEHLAKVARALTHHYTCVIHSSFTSCSCGIMPVENALKDLEDEWEEVDEPEGN